MNKLIPIILLLLAGCTTPTPDQLAMCEGKNPGDQCRAAFCTSDGTGYDSFDYCVAWQGKSFCPNRGAITKCPPMTLCEADPTSGMPECKTTDQMPSEEKDRWCRPCANDVATCLIGNAGGVDATGILCNLTAIKGGWAKALRTYKCSESGVMACGSCGDDRTRRLVRERFRCSNFEAPK